MNDIRLGIIGFGFRGAGLLDMAKTVDRLAPVAVCDENAENREKARALDDIRVYDSAEGLFSSGEIDAVLVETPPATHAGLVAAAMGHNIHVLSDVPAIHSIEEAKQVWEAAEKSDAVYMFGSTANYFGFVQTASDIIDKGLLGKPFYLEAEYIHDIREFCKMTPWRIGYEPIRYCTHSLGPVLKWLGKELVSVSCFDSGGHVEGDNPDAHDAMVAVFRTESNELVKLLVSFANSNPGGLHRYLCHGTRGSVECTWPLAGDAPSVSFSSQEIYGFDKPIDLAVDSQRPELGTLESVSGHGSLDYAMLCDFVTAIDGGHNPLGLREGLAMTLPGLFALESAQNGGRLTEIRYPWD